MVTHTQNLCSAFNLSKCTHTVVNTHITWTTHPEQRAAILLWLPGSSWGFGALLKCLTSVVVLRVEESAVNSLLPPTIPDGPETRTHNLRVTSPTLYAMTAPLLRVRGYKIQVVQSKKTLCLWNVPIIIGILCEFVCVCVFWMWYFTFST